ncbi:MAG: hypothetical protein IPP47_13350 [Bryobacterales bacterium]|nr:hypothetical protein [Bryobacterales bacterium]
MNPLVRFSSVFAMTLAMLVPAPAQTNSVTVDARANIYAAGRGVAFNGIVPPAVRFAAGAGKVVTFPGVAGQIACNGIAYEPLHGPDGTLTGCGSKGTTISSWAGISGTAHKTRAMFLVGVFLDEREPADPAPDRIDLSTTENLATYSPLIGQVFYIGDGRSAGGALQQMTVPAAATRLYLGFSDALNFSGAPSSYNDNNGSLQVSVAGLTPFVPGPVATGTTMTVNGKSSIFWSGLDVNWPTEMPPGWKFTAAPGRVMTVRASGTVTCKEGISAPPEGTSACGPKTDLEPWGAVSGIKHPSRSMFLVGLFLNDLKPRGWPPTALDFSNDAFTTLEPLIGQTFYIGTGAGKRFVVPHDATRVFLGYARSDQMIGNPGWYYQGGGSLSASIELTAGADAGVSPIQVDAKSNLYAAGRQTAFDGYLPPMVRLTPGTGKVLTVPQVTGKVRCCGGGYTTADGAPYHTNLNPYLGLSGIQAQWRGYFLAGVFLDDNAPDSAPPEKLVFKEPFDFPSLEPKIGQVFLIGDGVTSSGVPHKYSIPAAATRLYLGFAMGRLFSGDPGSYWEASDSYTATLNIAGGSTPPPTCDYSISPSTQAVAAAGATGSVSVTTTSGCTWTAVSAVPWITVTSGATGTGSSAVAYSVSANTGPARTGTLTIAGQTLTVTQAAGTTTCSYSINPVTQAVPAAGGALTMQVTAGTGCTWTAVSAVPWITVTSGATGTGPGAVAYSVAANTGPARTGTLAIAGQTLTVSQATGTTTCTYSINPSTQAVPAAGGALTVQVTASTGCAWTAASAAAWITVTSGATGTGPGAVAYSVAANTGPARAGTLTIAGQTLTVTQPAAPSVSPIEITDILNDADLTSTFAPGSVVFIIGGEFAASSTTLDFGVPWSNTLDGVSVEVTGGGRTLPAAIGGVAKGWVLAQLPFGNTSSVDLCVVTPAGRSAIRTISIAAQNPRLYSADTSGQGPAWAYHADNREVTAELPAKPGEEILIIGSGFGAVTPAVQAGQLGVDPSSGLEPNRVNETVVVEIQGISVRPSLAALDYLLVGAYIVTFTVPDQITSSAPSLLVRVGGAPSQQGVTLPAVPGSNPCTYTVTPISTQIPIAGGSGSFSVATGASCAWTAASSQAWLKVTSGASGTGNGTVSVAADANTGAARIGTLIIAGQTVTVTQESATASCTYSINPTTYSAAADGATFTVQVTTGPACSWTAASAATWLTVTAGHTGAGNGTVTLTTAANTGAARTATATIAGQTLTATQAATSSPTGPLIANEGVVNAADYTPNLAPGILFSVLGLNLAAGEASASGAPLPASLAGVTVEIVDGSRTVNAPLVSVAPGQVNAQMPFDIASWQVQVRVRNAQGLSNEQTITMAPRSPRILTQTFDGKGDAYAFHPDKSLVTGIAPAAPGEIITLYVIGLGAVTPPVDAGRPGGEGSPDKPFHLVSDTVAVKLGGQPAAVHFAGLAPALIGLYQVTFEVPKAPLYGSREIEVSVSNYSSQDAATLPVGMPKTTVGSGTIGPAGGTVSGGGAFITVPPGVVTESAEIVISKSEGPTAFDRDRIGDVYSASGVPFAGESSVSLAVELASPPPNPDEVFLVVHAGGEGRPPILVKAQVDGTRVTATFPESGDQQVPAIARSSNRPTTSAMATASVVFYAIFRWRRDLSSSDHFSLYYSTRFAPDRIIDYLEKAYAAADQAGIVAGAPNAAKGRIRVFLLPSSTLFVPDSSEPWGHIIRTEVSTIGIHEALILDPAEQARPKVNHMFMHYLLSTWDPRPLVRSAVDFALDRDEPWTWLDEALATWSERNFDPTYIPPQAVENADFLIKRGLEYPSSLLWLKPMRKHGYGASMFLEHFMYQMMIPRPTDAVSRMQGVKWLLQYRAARNEESTPGFKYSPIEALQLDRLNTLGGLWMLFCQDYPAGKIYETATGFLPLKSPVLPTTLPGGGNWSEHVTHILAAANTWQWGPSGPNPLTFYWDSPDLSARFYLIEFTGTWKQDTPDVAVTLTNSAGVEATALLFPVSQDRTTIGDLLETVEIDPSISFNTVGTNFAKSGRNLLIVVINQRAAMPGGNLSRLTLSVKPVGLPTPPPPPETKSHSWFGFSLEADISWKNGNFSGGAIGISSAYASSGNLVWTDSTSFKLTGTHDSLDHLHRTLVWEGAFSLATGLISTTISGTLKQTYSGGSFQGQNTGTQTFTFTVSGLPCTIHPNTGDSSTSFLDCRGLWTQYVSGLDFQTTWGTVSIDRDKTAEERVRIEINAVPRQ